MTTELQEIDTLPGEELLTLAAEIVAAYASRNQMAQDDLPALIRSVHGTLAGLAGGEGAPEAAAEPAAPPAPAVPIDASVQKNAIACLECGKTFKTLKRHLATEHGLSPAEYRERWQLSRDYPLVAPSYSKSRAATAKKIGLGRRPKS